MICISMVYVTLSLYKCISSPLLTSNNQLRFSIIPEILNNSEDILHSARVSASLYYKMTRQSGDDTKTFADWLRQTSKDKPWWCTLRTSNGGLAQA